MRHIQEYEGRAGFHAELDADGRALLVAVECLIGGYPNAIHALLDTAAQWCLLPLALAETVDPGERLTDILLHTRFGLLRGGLYRLPVLFPSSNGGLCRVEATWFVSPEWPGPAVIGWKGCLERLRFALDPFEGQFYFSREPTPPPSAPPARRRKRS